MTKSAARFSAWAVFGALLCFAPCALGQGVVNKAATGAGSNIFQNMPTASFLTFMIAPVADHKGSDWGGGGSNGCSNQGGGQNNNFGRDNGGWGGGGSNGGGGCTAVPEGGTPLMYLSIAGLCCLGAMALRSRRVRETN
jgi:hypothetical protein